ncbi:hypothetical protein VULLAG_LOCUS542 [Vulpes lagopus]
MWVSPCGMGGTPRRTELLNGIQSREQLLQLLAEAGAADNLQDSWGHLPTIEPACNQHCPDSLHVQSRDLYQLLKRVQAVTK